MKRLLPVLAVAALVAVPAATARTSAVPTLQAGKLIVAFGDPAPGFASGTVRGNTVTNPRGYEVDLAAALAKKLGVTPVWMYSPWNSLFAPGTKKFDIAFQEATITAQRKKTVDFTTSYLNANQGVLLSKQATVPKSLADLKTMQLCAQTNTTGLDWINTQLHPTTKVLAYPTTTAAYQAVQINRCDAMILDVPLVSLERKARPTKYGPVAGQVVTHEQYGAVLQKGSKLLAPVDSAMKALTTDGTVGKLQKKWFNLDFSKIPVLK
ncbi:MAG: polar amino acid transport system substrate-binding protein [Gaiellaceae bacterium]|nr:polar amino acid transport system substrate-binding protein [Gaiellaceae bacterium]